MTEIRPREKQVMTAEEEARCERICLSIQGKQNGDQRAFDFNPLACASRLLNAGMPAQEVIGLLLKVLDNWDGIEDPLWYLREELVGQPEFREVLRSGDSRSESSEGDTFTGIGEVLRRLQRGS